jgi:hypothetical protein
MSNLKLTSRCAIDIVHSTVALICDIYDIILLGTTRRRTQFDDIYKAMSCISIASSIRLITLIIMSAVTLLIFITTGMMLYNHHHDRHHHHHHRQLTDNSITKDLPLITTTDLSTSVGPMVISSSSSNIPSLERQALQDLYTSTDGPNWNYGGSSHWDFSNPNVNP